MSSEELKSAMEPRTDAIPPLHGDAGEPLLDCGTANFGDRMPLMANFRATRNHARRIGVQRLLVALAGCYALSTVLGQPAAPASDSVTAAPPAATDSGTDSRLVT